MTSADQSGTLLARNPERGAFAAGVAFARAVAPPGARIHHSGDRTAFIGRNGSPARPAALLGAAVTVALGVCVILVGTYPTPLIEAIRGLVGAG